MAFSKNTFLFIYLLYIHGSLIGILSSILNQLCLTIIYFITLHSTYFSTCSVSILTPGEMKLDKKCISVTIVLLF